MKNIVKYTTAVAAVLASLTACQEFEDYNKTVDAVPGLVYANTGTENLYTAKIVHRPTGSTGEFSAKFGLNCNTTLHGDAKVAFVYDASLVESYNAEHETSYIALPEEYLTLENAIVTLPENALLSADSVTVTLAGDLAALTERGYLAPLRLKAEGIGASSVKGAVYFAVETEVNLVRPVKSVNDMVGFPAAGRSAWTADCADFASLFDGNTATTSTFQQQSSVLNVDMKEKQLVTGLCLGYGSIPSAVSVEYSLDGETYEQAGTPVSGEYVTNSSKMYIAFYDHIEARYLRLTIKFGSNKALSEVNIYKIDSTEPAVYALNGEDNVITGKITHKKATGSTSDLNASFNAYATVASASGYSVTVAADNSLVATYNAAHGTAYAALPTGYLQLENATLAIAANTYMSDAKAKATLAGDLTELTDTNGYLVPLKLSASGAQTSESRGVMYVVVKVENNVIRPITSVNDMIGFPAAGRSAWSADCTDFSNLFDGNTSTQASLAAQNNNVLTIDMQQTRLVTGIVLNSATTSSLSFEYSLDGQKFETAGTPAASGESVTSGSDRYYAFYDHLKARYLRMTINFSSSSTSNRYIREFNIYEIESENPTIYAMCGNDNLLTGAIAHTPAGSYNGVNVAFNVYTTVSSASGYSVSVAADDTLVAAYNKANGTSYATLGSSLVKIENAPCTIAAGQNKSADQVKVSLTGDLTGLKNANGYLIPLKLSVQGADVSVSRGVVYVAVTPTDEVFRKNFTAADIAGTPVADRSGWSIVSCDESGIYPGTSYDNLLDGDTKTYIRTWGGPVFFTLKLDKEYDMTGLVITARTDNSSYQNYQPNDVMIEYSADGEDWETLGTPAYSNGDLVRAIPSSYVSLYGSQKMRYLRITASYGSNMGVGEFNIYAK